jgi:uncharacterized protein (UPF0332 family)
MDGERMTGRDFLPVAVQLASGATEAEWRTAVSRAYYAAFHVARDLMEALRFKVPYAEAAHGHMWIRLSNCGEPQVQRAGADLNDLRRRRNQADYDLHRPLFQNRTLALVRLAEQIIQTLDNLTPTVRTQITDAMKIYERDVLKDVTWTP